MVTISAILRPDNRTCGNDRQYNVGESGLIAIASSLVLVPITTGIKLISVHLQFKDISMYVTYSYIPPKCAISVYYCASGTYSVRC